LEPLLKSEWVEPVRLLAGSRGQGRAKPGEANP
jgi:hypothetical protein